MNTFTVLEYIEVNKPYCNIRNRLRCFVTTYGQEVSRLYYNVNYKDATLDRYYAKLNELEDIIDTLIKVLQYQGIKISNAMLDRYNRYVELRENANR